MSAYGHDRQAVNALFLCDSSEVTDWRVVVSTAKTLITADDLFARPDDGWRYELVKGELRRMPPSGSEHGAIVMNVGVPVGQFVKSHDLGVVFGAETGFRLASDPDTVRAPDLAFVRRERISEAGIPREFWTGGPDLAVEVVSPSDRYTEVEEKAQDWLDAGTRMVVVVNPRTRTVTVYRSSTEVIRLTESDRFNGDDVLPGFTCRVSEFFL